jgi:hypothetical protein
MTLDEDPDADYEGIRKIRALDWLMGNRRSDALSNAGSRST